MSKFNIGLVATYSVAFYGKLVFWHFQEHFEFLHFH